MTIVASQATTRGVLTSKRWPERRFPLQLAQAHGAGKAQPEIICSMHRYSIVHHHQHSPLPLPVAIAPLSLLKPYYLPQAVFPFRASGFLVIAFLAPKQSSSLSCPLMAQKKDRDRDIESKRPRQRQSEEKGQHKERDHDHDRDGDGDRDKKDESLTTHT